MPALAAVPRSTREELAATHAGLAWPVIMTNLAFSAISTTMC
jgi:hypothetical protein